MIKVNLGGCASFVKDEDYKEYVGKALEAFDVLANESGAGNDFLVCRPRHRKRLSPSARPYATTGRQRE